VKITRKGQVTIPKEFRERFGLLPGTEVAFLAEDGRVFVERVFVGCAADRGARGHDLVPRMSGTATGRMTTDEIMALTRD